MSAADWDAMSRTELLERLEILNHALDRYHAPPLVTVVEGGVLPHDNLAGMVAATADRLVTVARGLSGIL